MKTPTLHTAPLGAEHPHYPSEKSAPVQSATFAGFLRDEQAKHEAWQESMAARLAARVRPTE